MLRCSQHFLILLLLAHLYSCKNSIESRSTKSGNKEPALTSTESKLPLNKLKLPPGFHISVFSDNVEGARTIVRGDKGTIFVSTREEGKVYALTDKDNDGKADILYIIAEGLNQPNGLAFRNGSLYVAEIDRIQRYDEIEDHLQAPKVPATLTTKLPDKKHHGWRYMAFGPDGKLYIAIGAPCNVCEEHDPFATIQRMNPDGSGMETFARGVRNSVGFDWNPQTKELWFTDNGRDDMGDNLPPDELNRAAKAGLHFGYPYCHGGDVTDPKYGSKKECNQFIPPVLRLDAHVASLGMRFYTGNMFPAKYRNQIFIAEHGSWNSSSRVGYRIMLATLNGDKGTSYEPFITGWLDNGTVWGRPVDVQPLPDGSLLISDDRAGAVYRVTYE